MEKLNQLANFYLQDAIENNYSAESIEVAIKLHYEPLVADLIIGMINYKVGA